MDNFSTEDTSFDPITSQKSWIICLAATCTLLISHLWIATRMLFYAVTTTKRRSSLNGGLILKTGAVAMIVPLFRYAATLALAIVMLDENNDKGCEIVIDFGKSAFAMAIVITNGFYWVRQRAFYRHPCLGHTFGKCAGILSQTSIALIIILAIIIIPLTVFPAEYEASPKGCVFRGGNEQYSFRTYIYAGAMLICQMMLLGLFTYPLWIHHTTQANETLAKAEHSTKSNESHGIPTVSEVGEESTRCSEISPVARKTEDESFCKSSNESTKKTTKVKKQKAKKKPNNSSQDVTRNKVRVMKLLKRTVCLSLLAVITDVATAIIVGVILPKDTPQVWNRLVYDIDLFINVATVVGSFQNWKVILSPTNERRDLSVSSATDLPEVQSCRSHNL